MSIRLFLRAFGKTTHGKTRRSRLLLLAFFALMTALVGQLSYGHIPEDRKATVKLAATRVVSTPKNEIASDLSVFEGEDETEEDEENALSCGGCCCCPPCCCPEDPNNDPPTITDFNAVYDPASDEWTFSGWVEDEDEDSCTVTFGGILEGQQSDVDTEGYFELVIDLNGQQGLATALAEDAEGAESEEDYEEV